MNTRDAELEKFFIYRLIQVLYYGSLIIGQIFIFFIAYKLLPPQILYKKITYDPTRSAFTCTNGKKYMFSNTIDTYYTKYIWQSDIMGSLKNKKGELERFCDTSFNYSNYLKEQENREIKLKEFYERIGAISESELDANRMNIFDYSDETHVSMKSGYIKNVKTIDISYKKYEAHWLNFILKFIGTVLLYYFLLNILRETAIYLCLGRKFTWSWLKIYNKEKLGKT